MKFSSFVLFGVQPDLTKLANNRPTCIFFFDTCHMNHRHLCCYVFASGIHRHIIPAYPTISRSMGISGKMGQKYGTFTYLHILRVWNSHWLAGLRLSDQSQITFCQTQIKIYRDTEWSGATKRFFQSGHFWVFGDTSPGCKCFIPCYIHGMIWVTMWVIIWIIWIITRVLGGARISKPVWIMAPHWAMDRLWGKPGSDRALDVPPVRDMFGECKIFDDIYIYLYIYIYIYLYLSIYIYLFLSISIHIDLYDVWWYI